MGRTGDGWNIGGGGGGAYPWSKYSSGGCVIGDLGGSGDIFLGIKSGGCGGSSGNVGRACFPRSKFLVMSVLCGDSLLFSNWVTFGVMFLWCRKLCGGGGTLFPKCSLVVAGFGGAAYPVSNIVLDVVIFMCGGLTSDCGSFFFGVSVVLVYLGVSSC